MSGEWLRLLKPDGIDGRSCCWPNDLSRVCASLFSLSISFVNWAGRLSYLLTNLETVFFALFLFLSSWSRATGSDAGGFLA